MLNCKFVSLSLEVSRLINFFVLRKFSWRYKLVLRTCLYMNITECYPVPHVALIGNDLSCSVTVSSIEWYKLYQQIGQKVVYWRRNSTFANKHTKCSVLLKYDCVAVWAVATIANHLLYEMSGNDYIVAKFCIANNGSHTTPLWKFTKIWIFDATSKCVNFPPVQAVTNLTFTRQLIGMKFCRISVHCDWGTRDCPLSVIWGKYLDIASCYRTIAITNFCIKFSTRQRTITHYTVWTVGNFFR